jgi:hypothetical protein
LREVLTRSGKPWPILEFSIAQSREHGFFNF